MKQILLDTNFILNCINQKIDFFEDLQLRGFQILIPKQVLSEIENIINSKQKLHIKESAKLALRLLEKYKFKKINLIGKNTDKAIIQFANKNKKIIVATLDREIKGKIKNHKLIIRNKKKLEII